MLFGGICLPSKDKALHSVPSIAGAEDGIQVLVHALPVLYY